MEGYFAYQVKGIDVPFKKIVIFDIFYLDLNIEKVIFAYSSIDSKIIVGIPFESP